MPNPQYPTTQSLITTRINNPVITQSAKPRHILEEIVSHKQQEVAKRCEQLSLEALKNQASVAPAPRDFLSALWQNHTKLSLIAEVKKASPSKE
jgi:indole-3-glycerol phosphate synthase